MILITVASSTHGQTSQNDNRDTLSVQVFECDWESIEFVVPSDWKNIENFEYMEGFIKTYKYSDGSTISILCGANAHLNISDQTLNSRKIIVGGHEIIYERVPNERVHFFDEAFDRMEKNKITIPSTVVH